MPNTIAENLQRLVNAKNAISSAILAQGGTVNSGDGLEDFPSDIATITGTIEHYGLKWEKNNSDPQARCTYLYDCANFTPMQCQEDGSVAMGSWSNAFFIKNNYPAMVKPDGTIDYKLDPVDHTKDLSGNDSHVSDHATDNAMSVFDCHIWIKWYEDADYQYVEIANAKLDNDFYDYPYHRADGRVNNRLFYPMFEGTIDGSGKLRSLATGTIPESNTTLEEEYMAASLNGSNWQIGDWSHHFWFTMLCMMIGKSTCPEQALGEGVTTAGASQYSFATCGTLKSSGQFYGKPRSTSVVTPCKAFFVENYQANRLKRCLGFYGISGKQYLKMAPPYTIDGDIATYTDCGTIPSSGCVKSITSTSCGFVISGTGGGTSQYEGAYLTTKSENYCALLTGGHLASTSYCGLWFMDLQKTSLSSTSWAAGASLYLR